MSNCTYHPLNVDEVWADGRGDFWYVMYVTKEVNFYCKCISSNNHEFIGDIQVFFKSGEGDNSKTSNDTLIYKVK